MKKTIIILTGIIIALVIVICSISVECYKLNARYEHLNDEFNYFLDVKLETDEYQDVVIAIMNDTID